jgi:hypothetical protein
MTNAWVEYLELVGIKFTKFRQMQNDVPNLTYPVYLSGKGFFGRLISCPWCLSFWLCIITNFRTPAYICQTYVLSILVFSLINKLNK